MGRLSWWMAVFVICSRCVSSNANDSQENVQIISNNSDEKESGYSESGEESTQDTLVVFMDNLTMPVEENEHEDNSTDEESTKYTGNIPTFIEPVHYSISLTVNLRDWNYVGGTQVLINVSDSCDHIPIHSLDLKITGVFLAEYDEYQFGRRIEDLQVAEDLDEQLIRIYPTERLRPGMYLLMVDFYKEFDNTSFWGFYGLSWTDEKGWLNKMVSTQFSPYWARKAWPCFDEPRFKARFKFFVEHESVYNAVSNGNLESRYPVRPGWVRSTFEWTPPMSTYVTAMVITNYRYLEGETKHGIPVRVYGSPNMLKHSMDQLNDVTKALDFFEDYFGIDYAMKKLYLMPVTRIGVAAMENWGLITAREDIANFNPAIHDAKWELQKRVIIDHEVAHMWFGNLVTAHWWDSIILKESTVSWLMTYAADNIYDDFDYTDEFVVLFDLLAAMKKDGTINSRPAISNPGTLNEIMGLFDEITYQRGGCIFRMIHHIVGPGPFRAALRNYLTENAFSTADMTDMNRHLEEASPDSGIKDIVERFTKQKNFPLVHVSMLNSTHVRVRQERFLYSDKNALQDSPYNYTWHLPFTYTTDSERNDQVITLKEKDNIVKLKKPATWIKANNDMRMFYITNYDVIGWRKLYFQLAKNHLFFTTTDRVQLLADLSNLVTAEKIHINFPLQFLSYLKKEREYGPWKIAYDYLAILLNDRMSSSMKFAAKIFVRDLVDERLKEVLKLSTSYKKPIKERLMQNLILKTALLGDHPVAMEYIDKLNNISRTKDDGIYEKFATSDDDGNEETESRVFYKQKRAKSEEQVNSDDEQETESGIVFLQKERRAQTDSDYWNELFRTIPSLSYQNDFSGVYSILGTINNKNAIESLLKSSLAANSEDAMQEAIMILSTKHPETVWNFVKINYAKYFEVFGKSQFIMAFMMRTAVENLSTQERYDEIEEFFNTHDAGTGKQGVREGLDKIADNIRWKTNHRLRCRDFFFTYAKKRAKRRFLDVL